MAGCRPVVLNAIAMVEFLKLLADELRTVVRQELILETEQREGLAKTLDCCSRVRMLDALDPGELGVGVDPQKPVVIHERARVVDVNALPRNGRVFPLAKCRRIWLSSILCT